MFLSSAIEVIMVTPNTGLSLLINREATVPELRLSLQESSIHALVTTERPRPQAASNSGYLTVTLQRMIEHMSSV